MEINVERSYLRDGTFAVRWKIAGGHDVYVKEEDVSAFILAINKIEMALDAGKWKEIVVINKEAIDDGENKGGGEKA